MTATPKSHIKMALDSIQMFANDGKIDEQELQQLLDLALQDGQIDAHEQKVLSSIFVNAEKAGVSAEVAAMIEKIRQRDAK